jgi:ubiquinone/menaquinone biosynthesis C-methylase UbiE
MNSIYRRRRPRKSDATTLYDRFATPIEQGGNNIRCYEAKKQFDALLAHPGPNFLDCACGMGDLAIWLALNGKRVHAFDFSEEGIEKAKESARLSGVAERIQFAVMDVASLEYPDGYFDVITGRDCLHHLIKWPAGVRQLARVLKPGGKGFFVEPLGFNPLGNAMRLFDSWLNKREGERVLGHRDVQFLRETFGDIVLRDHVILGALSRVLAASHATTALNWFQRAVCSRLHSLDTTLSAVPAFRNLAVVAFVEITRR